eukprot:m.960288 g.960288  ORF g.960288 m.960288 type:complete len:686 (+) comp23884_c0_seq4:1593-3650(+)
MLSAVIRGTIYMKETMHSCPCRGSTMANRPRRIPHVLYLCTMHVSKQNSWATSPQPGSHVFDETRELLHALRTRCSCIVQHSAVSTAAVFLVVELVCGVVTFHPSACVGRCGAGCSLRCSAVALRRTIFEQRILKTPGMSTRARTWVEFADLERKHGSVPHCRKVLRQALQRYCVLYAFHHTAHAVRLHIACYTSRAYDVIAMRAISRLFLQKNSVHRICRVSDDIDLVCDVLLTLESDLGSLEDYDASHAKITARKALTQERKAASEANQAARPAHASLVGQGKHKDGDGTRKRKRTNDERPDVGSTAAVKASAAATHPAKRRGVGEATGDAVCAGNASNRSGSVPVGPVPPAVVTGANALPKRIVAEAPVIDPSSYPRTVFAANLHLSVTEEDLATIFSKCGAVEEVRLVKTASGASKGFAFVQFANEGAVPDALKLDRHTEESLLNRPMLVSKCRDKAKPKGDSAPDVASGVADGSGVTHEPKYSQGIERNKLFVSGLSWSLTQDEIRDIFKPFGELQDVRLATKQNGQSRGFAYVEFVDPKCAGAAVVGCNDKEYKGRRIQVAISNPPKRAAAGGSAPANAPSAGAPGPRGDNAPGGATPTGRTKRPAFATVSATSFKPRASVVRRRPGLGFGGSGPTKMPVPSAGGSTLTSTADSANSDDRNSAGGKSNAFFAALFSGKK